MKNPFHSSLLSFSLLSISLFVFNCGKGLETGGGKPEFAEISMIVSSKGGERLKENEKIFFVEEKRTNLPLITVDENQTFQRIEGFGATFNEAGMICLNTLDRAEREKVLRNLFDPVQGAGFTMMSAPIAACDFASAGDWYSYDDVGDDFDLKHFTIERDLGPDGLIPYIRAAREFGDFKLETRMDYPPDWMLVDRYDLDNQFVKLECFDVLARYYVKYVQAYAENGVTVDYLSLFNEPQFIYTRITYSQIRDLIRDYVGPAFKKENLATKLQPCDPHGREVALKNLPVIMDDPGARQYINSMPSHGYFWKDQGSKALGKLHDMYPEVPIWQTEVCYTNTIAHKPVNGDSVPIFYFEDGDFWGRMIIADLENRVSVWMYWNMVLDQNGGPWLATEKGVQHRNGSPNAQHPVVIINRETKEVTYTGLYYYLSHFSKFVKPGAVRIGTESGNIKGISAVAFKGQNAEKILQVVNSNETDLEIGICYNNKTAAATLPAVSICTFIWH